MMTCCLSSLISLDLVSHVSNYTASRRDRSVLQVFNLMSLLPPAVILGWCPHNSRASEKSLIKMKGIKLSFIVHTGHTSSSSLALTQAANTQIHGHTDTRARTHSCIVHVFRFIFNKHENMSNMSAQSSGVRSALHRLELFSCFFCGAFCCVLQQ